VPLWIVTVEDTTEMSAGRMMPDKSLIKGGPIVGSFVGVVVVLNLLAIAIALWVFLTSRT
jgi:hypothetical protein